MEAQFWLDKWASMQIGFHEDEVHPLLSTHWDTLHVEAGARIFVPLCGKSKDMNWLRQRGHEIIGVELSEIAVTAFFSESGITATRDEYAGFVRFRGGGYTLLCGDVFKLTAAVIGPFAAFYDRAALIALPQDMRGSYGALMRDLSRATAVGLLITLFYPAGSVSPPPFLVSPEEVGSLYGHWADVDVLGNGSAVVKSVAGSETAWRVRAR